MIGLPCRCSGKSGRAGASRRLAIRPTSSGASAMKSRRKASTVGASSAGHATRPARIVGPSGCSSKVKSVTTPKLPPPPRSPQNRSGFSVSEARTIEPSATTTWHDLQRVDRQAHLAHQVADPAAERQPGDAGVADVAAGHRQPEGLALPVDVGVERAALRRHRPGRRIDDGAPHAGEVEHDAVVHERVSGDAVAAAPYGHGQAAVTRPPQRRGDVAGPLAAGEDGRAAVDLAVPDASLVVVRRVVGRDDVPAKSPASASVAGMSSTVMGLLPRSVVVLDHSATRGARPASIDPVLVQNP